jgi:toxin ParE1/3/4
VNRFRLSNDAVADLEDVYRYGAVVFGLRQADSYHKALEETFERLAEFPDIGVAFQAVPDARRFSHWPYVIVYIKKPDGILILRLLHGSLDFAR